MTLYTPNISIKSVAPVTSPQKGSKTKPNWYHAVYYQLSQPISDSWEVTFNQKLEYNLEYKLDLVQLWVYFEGVTPENSEDLKNKIKEAHTLVLDAIDESNEAEAAHQQAEKDFDTLAKEIVTPNNQ
jgi:hypothetical protein